MTDILVVSADANRLTEVIQAIGECGTHRTTRLVAGPEHLLGRDVDLNSFDILIVDLTTVREADLAIMNQLVRAHEQLACILLTSDVASTAIIAAMRAGFRDVLGWPLDRAAIAEALNRVQPQRPQGEQTQTQILSFMSCKGGAGTTLIAANTAYLLAATQKKRVLLIDLNQQFADAAFVVSTLTPSTTLPQICQQINRVDTAFIDASLLHVAPGFDILAGAGDPVRAAEIVPENFDRILSMVIPRYDVVVLDLGQTLNHLTMVALDRSTAIHVVLQATMPHLRAGRRLQEILGSLGYPSERIRLILNRYSRHDELTRNALQEVLGTTPFQTLPHDAAVAANAINQGVPVVDVARNSPLARGLVELAERLAHGTMAEQKKGGGSLFGFLKGRQTASKLEMT